jgi:GxxExxY protein
MAERLRQKNYLNLSATIFLPEQSHPMPIDVPFQVMRLTKNEFAKLDYEVMKHAFACHKELGRLCDERIYQADLAARLIQAGFEIQREVRILVRHKNFEKEYLLDVLVINGAIYELKVTSAIVTDHETQLMNYLFIADIEHGKIINFRPSSVGFRFVNNPVSLSEQRRFVMHTMRWKSITDHCASMTSLMNDLGRDWGTYLEGRLYRDALTHFLGGDASVIKPITLKRGHIVLGQQPFHLLSDDVAFQITTAPSRQHLIKAQFRRLLHLTPLNAIQWINLARHEIQFTTISKS